MKPFETFYGSFYEQPLLLWMVDRALAQQNRFNLAVLALCSTSVVAATLYRATSSPK